ncbi:MAG: M56 family metallopeptidase [Thermoanaerobaculaceae bacterium]
MSPAELVQWVMDAVGRHVLYTAVAAAAAGAAIALLRIRSGAVREALWGLVLLRLVLPTDLASPYSLRALAAPAAAVTVPTRAAATPDPAVLPVLPPSQPASPAPPSSWPAALAIGWLLAGAVVLGLAASRWARFRSVARATSAVREQHVLDAANLLRARLGIGREVELRSSATSLAPFTLGLWRPVIVLPEGMLSWPITALAPVLAHELAHVRRLDGLRAVLAQVARAVQVANPIAWLAFSQWVEARERACDELAVTACEVPRRELARSLVAVAQLQVLGSAPLAAAPLGAGSATLHRRVTRLASGTVPGPARRRLGVAAVLAAGALVLPMAPYSARLASGAGQSPVAPPPAPVPTPAPQQPRSQPARESGAPVTVATPTPAVWPGPPCELPDGVRVRGQMPSYTNEARDRREWAICILALSVGADGTPRNVTGKPHLGSHLCAGAASAARQWRLEGAPEAVGGEWVAVVRFGLDERAPDGSLGVARLCSLSRPKPEPTPGPSAERDREIVESVVRRVVDALVAREVDLRRVETNEKHEVSVTVVARSEAALARVIEALEADPYLEKVVVRERKLQGFGTFTATLGLLTTPDIPVVNGSTPIFATPRR